MHKYKYFFNDYKVFDNPFDMKDAWKNLFDGLFPVSRVFYGREEALYDRYQREQGIDQDELEMNSVRKPDTERLLQEFNEENRK